MHAASALVFFFAAVLVQVRAHPLSPDTRAASTSCPISHDVVPLPAGQSNLTRPTDAKPVYLAFGFGTQNYTCTDAGTYTSSGAIAKLYDASCHCAASKSATSSAALRAALGPHPKLLGDHYSVAVPGLAGVQPTFDFRAASRRGDSNAFVVASVAATAPAPNDPATNIAWAELTGIPGDGTLAKYVFRVYTIGGQPPAQCTPGSAEITVPYATTYYFLN